ncbi:sensor histidine kinase [Paenactinomyces guangxiensis]|uniref:histidine kinase n=1 Tax=Paenactinomyces guangxiensis TaxID=1490290 RepID=A0A7W2A7F4_9BACL|nr:HAMP domain-containing sensor histidine kinase [Paenactinomyces guangxiensis]MBA4492738.1 HAMP domain-containing histidine kinase [Paenactinomyces guangxiensis]MBH8590413.1 HAMP domain-containing histidine kinase [Paenactinomyces guangxiensis]
MKWSIKVKSGIFLAGLLLLTVVILSVTVLRGIQENQRKNHEDFLAQQSKIANLYITQNFLIGYEGRTAAIDRFLNEKGEEMAANLGFMSGMHVKLFDRSGKEKGNSAPSIGETDTSDLLKYALNGKVAYWQKNDSMYYAAPLLNYDQQMGVIQFQYPLKDSLLFYEGILTLFYRIGTLIFIISFIIGYLYFSRLTGGIQKLKQAVEKIQRGRFLSHPPLKRRDELGTLSHGIYYMSNQIAENIALMQQEEKKLKQAIETLKKLEQKQKEFIGNITHEFKTPLTVMKAYVDLMDMYPDDPRLVIDARQNIGKVTESLIEMVDKVLHLASLEKYDLTSQAESVDVKETLLDLCERMKGKAQKFGLQIEACLSEALIWADKESFTHVFINLLDNAIKYNEPHGKIVVKNVVEQNRVCIDVIDTGTGIPAEARDKIFEPFFTVNKDRSRQSGGTGLGLSLVKKLVEKQQGEIALLKTDNKGSCFRVTFPLLS